MNKADPTIDDYLEQVGWALERHLGRIRSSLEPVRFQTAHDLARYVCANADVAPFEPPVCATVTTFYDLRPRLASFAAVPERSVRPDTPLCDLLKERSWKDLSQFLGAKLPSWKVTSDLGIFFITAFAFQCAFLPFCFTDGLRQAFFWMVVSLILSVMETSLLGAILAMERPELPPPHLQTVGDLACFLALRPDVERRIGGWSVSEVRQLFRYELAAALGKSVGAVKLRKETVHV